MRQRTRRDMARIRELKRLHLLWKNDLYISRRTINGGIWWFVRYRIDKEKAAGPWGTRSQAVWWANKNYKKCIEEKIDGVLLGAP